MQKLKKEKKPSFCVVRDHEMFYTGLKCVFIKCDQKSRLVCAQCLYQKLHQHGQQNTFHIITLEKEDQLPKRIKDLANKEIRLIKEDFQIKIDQRLQDLQVLQDQVYSNDRRKNIYLNMIFIRDDHFQRIERLKTILSKYDTNLEESHQKFLDELNQGNIYFDNKLQKYSDSKTKKLTFRFELLNNIKELKGLQHFNQENNQFNQDEGLLYFNMYSPPLNWDDGLEYFNQFLFYQDDIDFHEDQTFLIFCQNDLVRIQSNNLEVYNIHNNELKNTINKKIQRKITCLSFNYDNTILFFVDYVGYVYGCDINKDYDIIFKRKIHSNRIEHIYSIYDEIITIDCRNTLKITNIRNGKQIFKNKQFKLNDSLAVVGYDFVGGNIILECEDQVKIYNRFKHKVILNHNFFSKIKGQFLQPNHLLILQYSVLKKIEINFQQGQVREVKSFEGNSFECFNSVEYGNKFILISKGEIFILDQNLELILQFTLSLYNFRLPNQSKIQYIHCMEQIVIVKDELILIFKDTMGDNQNMQQLKEKQIYPRKYIPISNN